MRRSIWKRIEEILKKHVLHGKWVRAVIALACVVIYITTYVLIMPAVTMARTTDCGQEEHTHTGDCYETETELTCGREEHTHTDDCYDEEGNLICGMEEHVHDDSCYTSREVLVCGQEEHVHTEDCYAEEEPVQEDIQEEAEEEEQEEFTVENEEEQPQAGDTVMEPAGTAAPEQLSQIRFKEYLTDWTTLYYAPEDGDNWQPLAEDKWHSLYKDNWGIRRDTADRGLDPEEYVLLHIGYRIPAGQINATNPEAEFILPLSIGMTEEEVRDNNKYYYTLFSGTDREADQLFVDGEYEIKEEWNSDGEVTQRKLVITFNEDACLRCGGEKLTDGTETLAAEELEGFFELRVKAEDLLTLKKTEEASYVLEWNDEEDLDTIIRFDPEKLAAYYGEENTEDTEAEPETERPVSGELRAEGEDYTITVSYTEEASLPANVSLKVKEITRKKEYESYKAQMEEELIDPESTKVTGARFFDITLEDSEGNELHPESGVRVLIETKDTLQENEKVQICHFDEEKDKPVEVESREVTGETYEEENLGVEFEAESFSVYGIVYTVDFQYTVDGKTYEFSIPGGGFVTLQQLVEVLGIADSDENEEADAQEEDTQAEKRLTLADVEISDRTKEFVADIENVEFSDSDLAWIGKADENSTVGGLKDANGLECQYSAELTEEQITEINAQAVESGDWALISLQPFTSEETLTVTMKNGEQFVIKVTDAQIHTYVISDSGDTYKITVTYDDTTGIPADAELRARLLTPEDERYQEDIDRSNAALLARYDEEVTNPLVFEIKIFANDEEIEPLEGTHVGVEISLAMDLVTGQPQSENVETEEEDAHGDEDAAESQAEEGTMLIGGVEYTPEPTEVDPEAARVVHLTDEGEAEIVEDLNGTIDTDNNLVLTFETESFSDYMLQQVYNNSGLNGLPDVIYVGDEIYLQNCPQIWVTNIGTVVSETKHNNNDSYKVVRATSTGTFRICHQNDWNNGETGQYNGQYPGKFITVLPARDEGNYNGTTPPSTIETVSNASIGLKLNLFDYDLDEYLDDRFNNKDYNGGPVTAFDNHGINSGHSLKFWGSGITDSSYGTQNNYVEHGVTSIVNSNLRDGYPTLRSDNSSLSYLFTPSDGTDKKAYPNADGLFKKDGDYYVYNSNQNYAWYNPATNSFEVYSGTYKQKSRSKGGEQATQLEDKAIGFFPFHEWDDQYDLYVNWNKNLNHHFGMSMEVKFSMPKDPKAVVDTSGNPITFEFSGDDDMWVFIDGKLAMDIGGIHQPTSGTINFRDQTVTVNGQSQSFTFSGLYDGEPHTLQVFYIERGGCDSNCMIKFNLTQYGDAEFDKVDQDNPNDKLGGAIFGLYKNEACTEPLMERLNASHNNASRAYVAESDEHGHVKFEDIPLGTYYLKEIKAPEGYPLDSTVHTVYVYLDENTGEVKTTIDGTDVTNPGVQIFNQKPEPIQLGLKKEWKDQNGNTIPAPEKTSAVFELKRIRNYEEITEEERVDENEVKTSKLVVGWVHNGQYHVHKEYTLIAGSTATVSWSYVNGYTGSKDCYENGNFIDKNEANEIINEALTMPADGGTATLYIVDESEHGDAIKNINVAGEQYFGSGGGGIIHHFETVTETDPDFDYSVYDPDDANVVNNRISLPVRGDTPWQYEFVNLPLIGRNPNSDTTYSYSYYLEEISSEVPEGTTVIYRDSNGNVISSADDAETSQTGTQTITNQVDLGALELTKDITLLIDGQTQAMTEPNKWVNGTVSFSIEGVADTFTEGISHTVEITYQEGKVKSYKIDNTVTQLDPAVNGGTYRVLVDNLVPGDYVITETGSNNLNLTDISGGTDNGDVTAKTVTVTVTHGKNTANTLDSTAKTTFTNNLETADVSATKTWSDLNSGKTHPPIWFRLFYKTENGDVAVGGVKMKPLPSGTAASVTVKWDDLPKYDQNGNEYQYLVKEYIQSDTGAYEEDGVYYAEAAPNGYVATEIGLSITNTESDKYDPRTEYTGRKTWVDPDNKAVRPGDLTVTLKIDKTGNGPSNDDETVMDAATGEPLKPAWQKPEGSDEWTYTFNNLPVYDSDWNIIHYYAVETPVSGYEQDTPVITDTSYVYTSSYTAQQIENDQDVTISSEIKYLPFVAIKKDNAWNYSEHYHIWTVRTATAAEKTELIRILNSYLGTSEANSGNTRFVSGLPVGKASGGQVEFLYGDSSHGGYKIRITKTGGDNLNVGVDNHGAFQYILVGTMEYNYSSGGTAFKNTIKTKDYDIRKTWGSSQTPPEDAEVLFTLKATKLPGPTEEVPDPVPVQVEDLASELGVQKVTVMLNGGKKDETSGEYTGDDTEEAPWTYHWTDLPQFDKDGAEITYYAEETGYLLDGISYNLSGVTSEPESIGDGKTRLVFTNELPEKDISAHKFWPAGQTVPEGTRITLTISAKLEDDSDPAGVNISPVSVTLDGKVSDDADVETADTLWHYTWKDLPLYDTNGKKIIYSVEETEYYIGETSYNDLLANANEPAYEGVDFSFTNELPVTTLTVNKTWSDGTGTWPEDVAVIMKLKGSAPNADSAEPVPIETLTLPDITVGEDTVAQTAEYALTADEASHTWINLPMYTLSGYPITYTADETNMTYTPEGGEPVVIENWAQAYTPGKEQDGNTVTIDNTPVETEIKLTKMWLVNDQPRPMENGDAIVYEFYRTDQEEALSLADYTCVADKGSLEPNKIIYVGTGSESGWQTVTISGLPKYLLKLGTNSEGSAIAYYDGIGYYAVETGMGRHTRITYNGSSVAQDAAVNDANTTFTIINSDTEVDINVLKVDETDPDRHLSGAVFQILMWNEENSRYQPLNLTTMEFTEAGQEVTSKLTTQSDGTLTFENLPPGKYQIVETKSPVGYVLVDEVKMFFTISDEGTVTWIDQDGNTIDPEDKPDHVDYDDLTFTVDNTPGASLPNAGGPGTTLFTSLGAMLIAFAGAGLAWMRKRRREQVIN